MPLLGRTSPEPFARPNTPGSLEPTPYREAFEACQFLLARFFHIELESTARATPYENQGLAFEILPHTFNRMVTTAEPQERGNVTYGIYMGMMSLANAYPIHIDSFLQIYLKAVELSPSDQGDASLSFQIFMNMGETCNTGYRTNDFWTQPVIYRPGTLDPLDSSNLNFTEEDIEGNLSNVLRTSQRQAHEGNDYIVRAAMFARFGVFMKETHPFCINGYRIEECLRKETVGGRWIKAELIATLVRLRGYAKSLSEKFAAEEGTYSRLNEWQRLLRRWLYDPELNMTNDPMVKYHVLVSKQQRRKTIDIRADLN
ncbi:hypothetical protein MMC19_006011 [Ptychographa xylographoides]|nr:hypothetical protein [Ptychographa xylographoides]